MKNLKCIDEKRGRKALHKTHDLDAEFVRQNFGKTSNMTNKIRGERSKRKNLLQNLDFLDPAELEQMSLKDLDDLVKQHDKELEPFKKKQRKQDWLKHEKDVVDGINELFKTGFFVLNSKNTKSELTDNKNFIAKSVGGATHSDVQVVHGKKSFFVECKLNFDSAEYFKYGLKINKDNIQYDHKKYVEGLDQDEDYEQIEKINDIFNKINLQGFLNEIVKSNEVKTSWQKFLDNAVAVEEFIKSNEEFKDFVKNAQFKQVWPDDFKGFVKVFDTYCSFYIRKYDTLIEQLFTYFDSEELKVDDYKIQRHNEKNDKHVFLTMTSLKDQIEDLELEIYNKNAFENTVNQIFIIEAKFNALLNKKGYSLNKIMQLENKDKTKCFFQMFISSVERRSKFDEYNALLKEDKLGNMQICSEIPLKNDKLAKMITEFYVKKDHCAYIQINDTVYQFDTKFNPFNIPDLPIFNECMTNFNVTMKVSDNLNRISLHIRIVDVDSQKLQSKHIVSFKKNDKNYIGRYSKINQIEIKIS